MGCYIAGCKGGCACCLCWHNKWLNMKLTTNHLKYLFGERSKMQRWVLSSLCLLQSDPLGSWLEVDALCLVEMSTSIGLMPGIFPVRVDCSIHKLNGQSSCMSESFTVLCVWCSPIGLMEWWPSPCFAMINSLHYSLWNNSHLPYVMTMFEALPKIETFRYFGILGFPEWAKNRCPVLWFHLVQ